jgi:hypothetical protein
MWWGSFDSAALRMTGFLWRGGDNGNCKSRGEMRGSLHCALRAPVEMTESWGEWRRMGKGKARAKTNTEILKLRSRMTNLLGDEPFGGYERFGGDERFGRRFIAVGVG